MKHIHTLSLSLLFAVASFSCSDNNALIDQFEIQNETSSDLLKGVTAQVPDFEFEDATRAAHTFSPSTGFSFVWTEGDTLGIFPVGSNQVDFPVVDGIGTSRAEFSGGAWALRATYDYASYFPFRGDNYFRKMTELPVSYVGQEMDGNDPYANLGKYDFLVSAPAKTSAEGTVNLDLKHLGCYTLFMLTLPEPGNYSYLSISCDEPVFVHEATYDLSAATPALTPKKSYSTCRIDLKNVATTAANQSVNIPAMFAPVNLSGKTLTLSVLCDNGKLYSTTVGGKDMIAGKAYGYTPSIAFTEVIEVPMAKLKSGKDFNAAIKSLAKGSTTSYTSYNESNQSIKNIIFDYNSSVSTGKIVSTSDSDYPIYANYADGVITISTATAKLSCNSDMSYMFSYLQGLTELDLSGLNTQNVTTMLDLFYGCNALTSLDLSGFDTQNVTTMSGMFQKCNALVSLNLSGFNTQKVTETNRMFYECEVLLSLDLSSFNTQNVTNMQYMFFCCRTLQNLDLSNFRTQNVTTMYEMFAGCNALQSLILSNFNTANVSNMESMFSGCYALTNLELSTFNTSKVTTMKNMFYNCRSLTTIEVSNFDTKNVLDMDGIFSGCSKLTSLDLSGINTQNVTNMSRMFYNCQKLSDLNLSCLDTQNVEYMNSMFYDCNSLTSLDLSSFDTQNVRGMSYMFQYCRAITSLNLGLHFSIGASTSVGLMFSSSLANGCTISCTEATKNAISTGTSLQTSYITWNILP